MKQQRRVQGAAAKNTTKFNASVTKSDAATAEKTIKHSEGNAQYLKEKFKSPRSKQRNAYPDYRPYGNSSDLAHIQI